MIIDEKTKESGAGAPPEYSLQSAGSGHPPITNVAGPTRADSFTDADARTLLDLPPPYEAVHRSLPLPFVLPQETVGTNYAFTRGYNPALAASGIALPSWLRFVDALNLAMAGSLPRRIIGTVGAVHPLLELVGGVITAGAQVGQGSLSRAPADRVLHIANSEFFEPRGLSVRIRTTSELKALVKYGEQPSKQSKGKRVALGVGRMAKSYALHTGLGALVLDAFSEKRPRSDNIDSSALSSSERRLAALAPHVLPVFFDVPPRDNNSWDRKQAAGMNARLQASNEQRSADARYQLQEGDDRQVAELRRQRRLEDHWTEDLLWLVLMDAKLAELIHEFPMDVEPAGSSSQSSAQKSQS